MIVTNIEMYTGDIKVADFDFDSSTDNPYLIRALLGLDADEIVPQFYGFGYAPEAANFKNRLYDFVMPNRELVMRIVLNPDQTVGLTYSELRDNLYKAIAQSRHGMIQLRFNNGPVSLAYIEGFITKFEAPHFNQLQEVQLTIKCDQPMLKALHVFTEYPNKGGLTPARWLDPLTVMDNMSTAPHGFEMEFHYAGDTATNLFFIQDVSFSSGLTPTWEFKIFLPDPDRFEPGDKLYINTEASKKEIWMDRAGVVTHLGDRVGEGSVWPLIFPGRNDFYLWHWPDIQLNYLRYTQTYWGI